MATNLTELRKIQRLAPGALPRAIRQRELEAGTISGPRDPSPGIAEFNKTPEGRLLPLTDPAVAVNARLEGERREAVTGRSRRRNRRSTRLTGSEGLVSPAAPPFGQRQLLGQ